MGDIHAQALTTEEGAFIDGKITMTRPDITGEPLAEPFGAATGAVMADTMLTEDSLPAASDSSVDAPPSEEVVDVAEAVDADDDSALILDNTESDKPAG
ncbi:MAG: hypothetical protein IPK19_04405 [Chloroflexi bacterium]|nr:hypothetical protein [Chloroflexota bacterium]